MFPATSCKSVCLQVGATMGAGSSKSSSSASVPVLHRFGVGTASASEAAYPDLSSLVDPNALLYTQRSKPYGKQVGGIRLHLVYR